MYTVSSVLYFKRQSFSDICPLDLFIFVKSNFVVGTIDEFSCFKYG